MNKSVAAILFAIMLVFSGYFFQQFATVTYAAPLCDCDRGISTGPLTLASRSGFGQKAVSETPFTKYTIRSGDTLIQIARQFQTDVDTLVALNNVVDPKGLQIGAQLTIPKQIKQQELPALMSIDKILDFNLTAYTSGPESTGKAPGQPGFGVTATGTQATEGRTIAVDPRVIPYGTKVYIEGVGIRVAEDTGGAIKTNRIDVYMEDLQQALEFGVKKNVRVYILSSPNA